MWLALDDMSDANGGLRVLPFERNPRPGAGGEHAVLWRAAAREGGPERPMFRHRPVAAAEASAVNLPQDISGYFGDDSGDVVAVQAGAAIVFSALTFHGSGENRGPTNRRALNLAFGRGRAPAGAAAAQLRHNNVVPFLEGGRVLPTATALRAVAALPRL